jgi:hypothetical protein
VSDLRQSTLKSLLLRSNYRCSYSRSGTDVGVGAACAYKSKQQFGLENQRIGKVIQQRISPNIFETFGASECMNGSRNPSV